MHIDIYTDGSCSGNPGVGGYGAILKCGEHERIVRGCTSDITTNNCMELKAITESIIWINKIQKKPCEVTVYTDSNYVISCATNRNKDGTKRKLSWFAGRANEELWVQFISEVMKGKHIVRFVKVKGHSNDKTNARVDSIAREECAKAKHELTGRQ